MFGCAEKYTLQNAHSALLMVMIMTLVRRQGGRPTAFLFVASFLEILDRGAEEFQISVITEVTGADNQQDPDI